jgi:hypothetical protein
LDKDWIIPYCISGYNKLAEVCRHRVKESEFLKKKKKKKKENNWNSRPNEFS